MFTRILLVMTVFSAFSIPSPVPQSAGAFPPAATVVVWSPETGRQADIPVQQRQPTFREAQTIVFYEAEITNDILASLVNSKQKWDSSRAVKVTIWMYWDGFDYNGVTYVSVSRYKTQWQLYDSSVSMSNANMNAGCYGESWPGYDDCIPDKYQTGWIGYPTSGYYYSLYPYWAGNYTATRGSIGYQAGNSIVKLKRGGSTWWLEICIYKGSCGFD